MLIKKWALCKRHSRDQSAECNWCGIIHRTVPNKIRQVWCMALFLGYKKGTETRACKNSYFKPAMRMLVVLGASVCVGERWRRREIDDTTWAHNLVDILSDINVTKLHSRNKLGTLWNSAAWLMVPTVGDFSSVTKVSQIFPAKVFREWFDNLLMMASSNAHMSWHNLMFINIQRAGNFSLTFSVAMENFDLSSRHENKFAVEPATTSKFSKRL